MKQLSSLDARGIQTAIKEKKTPADLCGEYHCSLDDLKQRIERVYHRNPDKARKVYRDLEKNKKNKKIKGGPKKSGYVDYCVPQISPDDEVELVNPNPLKGPYLAPRPDVGSANSASNLDQLAEESSEATDNPKKEVGQPAPIIDICRDERSDANTEDELGELMRREEILSKEVIELENQHKGLMQKHRNNRKTLTALLADATRHYQEFLACEEKSNRAIEEINQIATEINQAVESRKEKITELEEVRRQIDNKKVISLFVYQDGNIEAPNDPSFVINDEGHLDLRQELLEREEYLDLRMRDIHTLARLLKVVEHAGERPLDITFESAALEEAFTLN